MQKLNLPEIENKILSDGTKLFIFDSIRKKYLVLTPEEWVRQHLISYLQKYLQYPAGLFRIESGLNYNKRLKRTDIQILDREGKLFLLCECKAPEVAISNQTLHQAMAYAKVLQPSFLLLSNGINHFIFAKSSENGQWAAINSFPEFPSV